MTRGRQLFAGDYAHRALVTRGSANLQLFVAGLLGTLILLALSTAALVGISQPVADAVGAGKWSRSLDENPLRPVLIFLLVGGLILSTVTGRYSFGRFRRWRAEKSLVRLAAASTESDHSGRVLYVSRERSVVVDPPNIRWIQQPRRTPRALRSVAGSRALTSSTNLIGAPRLEIVYLRLFNNHQRLGSFLSGAWREFGTVSMLRSADSLTLPEIRHAKESGGLDKLLAESDRSFERNLLSVARKPTAGWHRIDAGISRLLVRDKFGTFPFRALLVSNANWKHALDRLLDQADLVALDLSGFTDRNQGTRYELQRVIDRVPVRRLVVLADPASQRKIIDEQIAAAWNGMSADSPNATMPSEELWVAVVDYFQRSTDQNGQTNWRFVTSRPQTRSLLTTLQLQRMANARAIRQIGTSPAQSTSNAVPSAGQALSEERARTAEERGSVRSQRVVSTESASWLWPRAQWSKAALVIGVVVILAALLSLFRQNGLRSTTSRPPVEPQTTTTVPILARLPLPDCSGHVVQVGADSDQTAIEERLTDVLELLATIGSTAKVGWARGTDCGLTKDPTLFVGLVGPFPSLLAAEDVCRTLRRLEVANVNQFGWAKDPQQLAGFRTLGSQFAQCGA
jgi:hypothetical protein